MCVNRKTLGEGMIECGDCGWSSEKDVDLWSDPVPICPKCGSTDLQYLREPRCNRYCCLNCEKFREMMFPMVAELVDQRIGEILRNGQIRSENER